MKVKKFLSSVVVLATLFVTTIPLRATTSSFAVSAGGSQYSSNTYTLLSDHTECRAVLQWFEFYGLGRNHAPSASTVIHVRPYTLAYVQASDVMDFTCCDDTTWGKQKTLYSPSYGYEGKKLLLKTNSNYSLKGYYCDVVWYCLN